MADVEEAPEVEQPEEEIGDEGADAGLDDEDDIEGFVTSGATEVKLFGKWAFDNIEVRDLSLEVSYCCRQIKVAL